jgi:hypothetical protein
MRPGDPRSLTSLEKVHANITASTAAIPELTSFSPRAATATRNVHRLTFSSASPNSVAISMSMAVGLLLRRRRR